MIFSLLTIANRNKRNDSALKEVARVRCHQYHTWHGMIGKVGVPILNFYML